MPPLAPFLMGGGRALGYFLNWGTQVNPLPRPLDGPVSRQ